MSLKSTSDHLFQLVYSRSPQTQLLDSINTLYIDPEPPGSTGTSLTHTQQDLLRPRIQSRNKETHANTQWMCTNASPHRKCKVEIPNDIYSVSTAH